jgi:hypothetical protein
MCNPFPFLFFFSQYHITCHKKHLIGTGYYIARISISLLPIHFPARPPPSYFTILPGKIRLLHLESLFSARAHAHQPQQQQQHSDITTPSQCVSTAHSDLPHPSQKREHWEAEPPQTMTPQNAKHQINTRRLKGERDYK